MGSSSSPSALRGAPMLPPLVLRDWRGAHCVWGSNRRRPSCSVARSSHPRLLSPTVAVGRVAKTVRHEGFDIGAPVADKPRQACVSRPGALASPHCQSLNGQLQQVGDLLGGHPHTFCWPLCVRRSGVSLLSHSTLPVSESRCESTEKGEGVGPRNCARISRSPSSGPAPPAGRLRR